jgi:hypothetical protein
MLIAEKYRLIGLTAIAAAAALPALTAVADMPSAVSARSPVAVERDFGRAGSDAYWIQREPTAPPAPVVKAYDEAKTETIKAYDELKTLATQPPAHEPARYGRAGGFVGLDATDRSAQVRSGG